MNREGAPHALLVDAGRKHGVVGGMVDAVGEARNRCCKQHRGIAKGEAEQHECRAAEAEAADQDALGAEAVDQETHRRLRQAGDDAENGDREAELDEADAQLFLEDGEQRRQHHDVEMADEMRGRDGQQHAQPAVVGGWRLAGILQGNIGDHANQASVRRGRPQSSTRVGKKQLG